MTRLFRTLFPVMVVLMWQGCEEETMDSPPDCSEKPVVLELVSLEDATCNATDGTIVVAASGGSGTYRFLVNGGQPQPEATFDGVAAGTYEITALDENNCADTLEVSVKNKDGVNMAVELSAAGCKTSNGVVTILATDGVPPYEYRVGEGAFGTNNSFAGLSPGEYNVQVRDANGCSVSQSVLVSSGVSYETDISPIVRNNCAVSGCHNGTQAPDLRTFKGVHDNAANVKKLTQDGTMPLNGSLTQEQIDKIACWVDDGAPAN